MWTSPKGNTSDVEVTIRAPLNFGEPLIKGSPKIDPAIPFIDKFCCLLFVGCCLFVVVRRCLLFLFESAGNPPHIAIAVRNFYKPYRAIASLGALWPRFQKGVSPHA